MATFAAKIVSKSKEHRLEVGPLRNLEVERFSQTDARATAARHYAHHGGCQRRESALRDIPLVRLPRCQETIAAPEQRRIGPNRDLPEVRDHREHRAGALGYEHDS